MATTEEDLLNNIEGAITEIRYNVMGQKIYERYANNIASTYHYDPFTLRIDETQTHHESTGLVFRNLKYIFTIRAEI